MNTVSHVTGTPICIDAIEEAEKHPLEEMASRKNAEAILMCEPTYFEVRDVKNPFMEGNLQGIDKKLAERQWRDLKATFEKLGRPVHVIPAQPDLEDMVFTANQLAVDELPDGQRVVVLARMTHPSREREVPFFAEWFISQGYKVLELRQEGQPSPRFEGHGDATWHPNKRLMWGAYGFRSEQRAYDILSALMQTPVVRLRLVDPKFYHLDTAFCALDQDTAIIYPVAFEKHALELIHFYFKNVIEVSEQEANNFACNGVPVNRNYVVQKGSPQLCARLRALGFEPVEVDTSEFMKSGGSAFCLKMEFYS